MKWVGKEPPFEIRFLTTESTEYTELALKHCIMTSSSLVSTFVDENVFKTSTQPPRIQIYYLPEETGVDQLLRRYLRLRGWVSRFRLLGFWLR